MSIVRAEECVDVIGFQEVYRDAPLSTRALHDMTKFLRILRKTGYDDIPMDDHVLYVKREVALREAIMTKKVINSKYTRVIASTLRW